MRGEVVVVVAGDVDLPVHGALAEAIGRAARTAGVQRVVVDLSDTVFLDSGAIGTLMAARRSAAVLGVGVVITGASGMVRRVLAVTGVLDALSE